MEAASTRCKRHTAITAAYVLHHVQLGLVNCGEKKIIIVIVFVQY